MSLIPLQGVAKGGLQMGAKVDLQIGSDRRWDEPSRKKPAYSL
jgi:hypothetical protein